MTRDEFVAELLRLWKTQALELRANQMNHQASETETAIDVLSRTYTAQELVETK